MRNWIPFPFFFILESQPMEITYPSKWGTLNKWPLLGPVTLGLFQPFPIYAKHMQPLVLQGSCPRGHLGTSLCMTSASRKKHPSYYIMPALPGQRRNGGTLNSGKAMTLVQLNFFIKNWRQRHSECRELCLIYQTVVFVFLKKWIKHSLAESTRWKTL